MTSLRVSVSSDIEFLRGLLEQFSGDLLNAQIRDGKLRVVQWEDRLVGCIKFHVLWGTLPFLENLVILESERCRGHGTRAVRHWENEMASLGFDLVLMSTQSAKTAQHFWRKLGYKDCGSLIVQSQPTELFMQRRIVRKASP